MAKIFIIDDEPKLLEMIGSYLSREGYTVVTESDTTYVIDKIKSEQPDVIILDVLMPVMNGFDLLKHIRQFSPVPVLMLTAKSEEADKVLGLELGADDYLTKPFGLRELLARIRALLRRSQLTNPSSVHEGQNNSFLTHAFNGKDASIDDVHQEEVLQVGALRLYPQRMVLYKNSETINLTPTEFKILDTLMRHPGRVYTRVQLLEKLGDAYIGYDRVLDTHMSNLRKKIEDSPQNPKYIVTVYGIGYKMGQG
ncbi:MAG: response regulator transcription factor [Candidatus Carbobacillus sp.]|nr:response regulator transcription factor [Candidatus Carbobacillus sp.]